MSTYKLSVLENIAKKEKNTQIFGPFDSIKSISWQVISTFRGKLHTETDKHYQTVFEQVKIEPNLTFTAFRTIQPIPYLCSTLVPS